ncbi:alpha-glucosidase [Chitinophaga rupis]|uniref:Alpha-glucosidase n=1 Tax=Chitinophaga rupis TaxID=573321 RepID=A0A1H7P7B6_9BACT|nr:glycoside hydrolase family 31 protein [Chitinophaga rupis]SEL31526.1 alpha-glucosidase [Chitinophaga rupis]
MTILKFTKHIIAASLMILPLFSAAQQGGQKHIKLLKGERWYGGTVDEGNLAPYEPGYKFDLSGNNNGNQSAPLLVSTAGRYIWSNQPFKFMLSENELLISDNSDSVNIYNAGKTLSDAFTSASNKHFKASGQMPDSLLFTRPQYNTWIELVYNQNQPDILKYAHAIIDNGFPPGVLMIDDNWADYYGKFQFRKDRFPDAKQMILELHQLGFKVMIWVSPFISPDTEIFRELNDDRYLIMDSKGNKALRWKDATQPAIISWWNGYSACLDFTNSGAQTWYKKQLDNMSSQYGVDGFKFDAGDIEFYTGNILTYEKKNANEQCELWGVFGTYYKLNEYRAMWKRGGQPLAERLRDKKHNWNDLKKLIPNMIAAGLLGYQFTCPDMIGGGEYGSFIGLANFDQDLVVRSAECSALMPMMQFSVAPWRILDKEHLAAVKKAVALRKKYTPYILQTVSASAKSGEPVVRCMEYVFPNQGLSAVKDQFMLGDRLMVAPVLDKTSTRTVLFPKGKWVGQDGKVFTGPLKAVIQAPIGELPAFDRID